MTYAVAQTEGSSCKDSQTVMESRLFFKEGLVAHIQQTHQHEDLFF